MPTCSRLSSARTTGRNSRRSKEWCCALSAWWRLLPLDNHPVGVHSPAMFKRAIVVTALLSAACLAQAAKKPHPGLRPDAGAVTAGVYKSDYFGFEYKIPAGFTDRTAAMPK